jgi:hypothetical protein
MVRPLSNDLRKRVVAAVSKGESCRSAALLSSFLVRNWCGYTQRLSNRTLNQDQMSVLSGHQTQFPLTPRALP